MQQLNGNIFDKTVSASDIFCYFSCVDLFWYFEKKTYLETSAVKMEPQSPWEDVAVNLSCDLKKIRISEEDKFGVTITKKNPKPKNIKYMSCIPMQRGKKGKVHYKENNTYKKIWFAMFIF